jgi:glutamyl-tRNA reductase
MTVSLVAVVAEARRVPAAYRAAFAASLATSRLPGTVLVETCHRVELYGTGEGLRGALGDLPDGVRRLEGEAVVDHVIGVAVGLRSVMLAEDQILHQVRRGVASARALGPLPPELDRLFDVALRTGRRARTFLPTPRPNLADLAIDVARDGRPAGTVLVVGAGEMGRLAVRAVSVRGGRPVVTSRTETRAVQVARDSGAGISPFDPGPSVERFDGIVIALGGPWSIADTTALALGSGGAWVADLSSPPALPEALARRLGSRLTTVDGLANDPAPRPSASLVGRLRDLAAASRDDYLAWAAGHGRRVAARALAERAESARTRELEDLWRRVPTLSDEERTEVERMTRHLTERLLATPLDRLGQDVDGRHEQAARELFRL